MAKNNYVENLVIVPSPYLQHPYQRLCGSCIQGLLATNFSCVVTVWPLPFQVITLQYLLFFSFPKIHDEKIEWMLHVIVKHKECTDNVHVISLFYQFHVQSHLNRFYLITIVKSVIYMYRFGWKYSRSDMWHLFLKWDFCKKQFFYHFI